MQNALIGPGGFGPEEIAEVKTVEFIACLSGILLDQCASVVIRRHLLTDIV